MLVSYNWLKELVEIDSKPEELENILTMLGIEVEGIVDFRKKYDNFVVASVKSSEKHPDADKLSICEVDSGTQVSTVVCGAPNVAAGQKVVLAKLGAIVPAAGFKIEKRKIRKVKSEGMICSQVELELGDDSSGIWVLPADAPTGKPLAEYFGLDDIIFDVSLTPNRADCLSHIGVARELAAYFGTELKKPDLQINENGGPVEQSAVVEIEDADKCPRYTARVIKGITVGESPDWLKSRLSAIGLRPINNIVDITNYVLMESGQPLHAFDYDKISGHKIIVNIANEGEKFTTLDGKERKLDSQMLMICDAKGPVAIGGVMGGENSEINESSTNVLLESAYFDASSVRRTSKKLGIQSEASYRFERGVDFENVTYALDRAAALMAEIAGGTVDSGIIDVCPKPVDRKKVKLRFERARNLIGADISDQQMKAMLESLSFSIVDELEGSALFEVPPYRVDIEIEVDLIEEVARMHNYDNIESDYTTVINFGSEPIPEELSVPAKRKQASKFLVPKGYHEIITQNMLDPASAAIFGDKFIKIANPLGEELSIMRPSLVPAILRTIERNIRLGKGDLKLFEIGKTFHANEEAGKSFISGISEKEEIIIAMTGLAKPDHWSESSRKSDFYDIKGIVHELLALYRIDDKIKTKVIDNDNPVFSKNSLLLYHKKQHVGALGEVSNDLLKKFEIEQPVFLALLDMSLLYGMSSRRAYYSPVAPYPGMTRDLAFVVDESVPAEDILKEILQNGSKYLKNVEVFDVYAGKNIDEGKKSMAYKLLFASPERTLVEKEVGQAIEKIVKAIEKKFHAVLRKF